MVLSSRSAASATLALNAGLCERRLRRPDDFLFIVELLFAGRTGPDSLPGVCFISPVQICGATSLCLGHIGCDTGWVLSANSLRY
jgi:hypothetical protein